MALKSTIFKLNLSISDTVRNYYQDHVLTIARHPSENDQRLILRIAAFALNAHEYLKFTKGLSSIDEPDLWQIDLTGRIEHWIDLGQPIEKRIRQSCGKSDRVSIYTYQRGTPNAWFESIKSDVERFKHLRIVQLTVKDDSAIERMTERSMQLDCLIDEDQVSLTSEDEHLVIDMQVLKASSL